MDFSMFVVYTYLYMVYTHQFSFGGIHWEKSAVLHLVFWLQRYYCSESKLYLIASMHLY